MERIKIFFSEDSEINDAEMMQKEWRGDILVLINDKVYETQCITLKRFIKEYEFSISEGKTYFVDKFMIFVDKVDKKTIIDAILKIDRSVIKSKGPINLKKKYCNVFKELQDLNNWICVYKM